MSDPATFFGRIAEAYDATRDPLPEEAVDALAARLRERAGPALLEVGVGTGRVAAPLTARGLAVVGIDAARPMLARARAKGVARLLQGSAEALPFRDGAVDGVLFVHVLQLLPDAPRALSESVRVGRHGAFALLSPADPADPPCPPEDDATPLLVDALRRRGVEQPRLRNIRAWEGRFLEELPPSDLAVLFDRERTRPLTEPLESVRRLASRQFERVPPEVLLAAVAEVADRLGDRTRRVRERHVLAHWRADTLGPRRD